MLDSDEIVDELVSIINFANGMCSRSCHSHLIAIEFSLSELEEELETLKERRIYSKDDLLQVLSRYEALNAELNKSWLMVCQGPRHSFVPKRCWFIRRCASWMQRKRACQVERPSERLPYGARGLRGRSGSR